MVEVVGTKLKETLGTIQPTGALVLIEMLEKVITKTEGGILIDPKLADGMKAGMVERMRIIAKGPECKDFITVGSIGYCYPNTLEAIISIEDVEYGIISERAIKFLINEQEKI